MISPASLGHRKTVPSYQLAINTSQNDAQIALFQDKSFVGEVCWSKAKSHSEVITIHFEKLLSDLNIKLSQINKIYCVEGPGSFTGIRVGVNFSKALAYSLSCPMVAINALDLLALNCDQTDEKLIACIDAQKNSLFVTEFEFSNSKWKTLRKNIILKIDSLHDEINQKTYACGSGVTHYSEFIDASVLALVEAKQEWMLCDLKKYFKPHRFQINEKEVSCFDFQPTYLKASAAEEKLNSTF